MLMAPTPAKTRRIKLKPRPLGQIYYLTDGENVKIGFTLDWNKRKYAYSTYSPRHLELLTIHAGTRVDEKRLHRMFKPHRVKNEWYRQAPEVMDHIRGTLKELNAA